MLKTQEYCDQNNIQSFYCGINGINGFISRNFTKTIHDIENHEIHQQFQVSITIYLC